VEDLLARPDIDLVVLATPPLTHVDLVAAAASASKHLLVEKPMALSVAAARAMVQACDAAGVRLAVVSQHRFRAAPQAAKALIDQGRIGAIRMIRVFGPGAGWDIPLDSWNSDERNVTPFADWGAHAGDLLRWLSGSEPAFAFAQYASYTLAGPRGQSAMAQVTFANGVLAQVWLSYELPPPGMGSAMQLLIVGSDGVLDLDSYGTVRLQAPDGRWETAFQQAPFDPLDPDAPARLEAYARQLRDLVAAIRDGRDPWVSGREGLRTTALLEAADRSAATGRSMRFDDAGPHPVE
jgi:predicted dehydrogenase